MGQQQLLLILLAILIIGMAVYGALRLFELYTMDNARDRVRQEALYLYQEAQTYMVRPRYNGGGGGNYDGFQMPNFFVEEADIGYWISATGQSLQIYACSYGPGATLGIDGKNPVAIFITKNGTTPLQVTKLN